MDIRALLSTIDLTEIENHVKQIIDLVKEENKNVILLPGEENVYIQLDILKDDILAYRVVTGKLIIDGNNFMEIKRTIGKWNLSNLKNLIGEAESLPIINLLKKFIPLMNGHLSLIKLLTDEKKVLIQIKITDDEIIAYQTIVAVKNIEGKNKLFVTRVLGKYNLKEYIK